MTMDFTTKGDVRIIMANCVDNILSGCGVMSSAVTPASSWLFDTRDDQVKATESEAERFHSYIAKMLYLLKRVRPECLTAVAFLSTRVTKCNQDDLAKLRRLLGYLRATRERGIVLRVGKEIG